MNVIQIRAPVVDADTRIVALEAEVAALRTFVAGVVPFLIQVAQHVDASTPTVLPPNWITVKEAATHTGYSIETIYRLARLGEIDSMKVGGSVAVNRDSLTITK